MAQKKISELQSAGTLTLSADLLPIVNEGMTKKITIEEFLGYVPEASMDFQQLSGNWESTYNTVSSLSADWSAKAPTNNPLFSGLLTVNGNVSATGSIWLSLSSTAPSNTTTPVIWVDMYVEDVLYKLPLYQ